MEKKYKKEPVEIPLDITETDRMEQMPQMPQMDQMIEAQPMPQMGAVPMLDQMPQLGPMPLMQYPQMQQPQMQQPQMQQPQMQQPQMQQPQMMPQILCCPLLITMQCPFMQPEYAAMGQGMVPSPYMNNCNGADYYKNQQMASPYPCNPNMCGGNMY